MDIVHTIVPTSYVLMDILLDGAEEPAVCGGVLYLYESNASDGVCAYIEI